MASGKAAPAVFSPPAAEDLAPEPLSKKQQARMSRNKARRQAYRKTPKYQKLKAQLQGPAKGEVLAMRQFSEAAKIAAASPLKSLLFSASGYSGSNSHAAQAFVESLKDPQVRKAALQKLIPAPYE